MNQEEIKIIKEEAEKIRSMLLEAISVSDFITINKNEIAKQAGVAQPTVRRFLEGDKKVSDFSLFKIVSVFKPYKISKD